MTDSRSAPRPFTELLEADGPTLPDTSYLIRCDRIAGPNPVERRATVPRATIRSHLVGAADGAN